MKYGFVYIWYHSYKKMFYIGAHWGTEDDGYICSSNWMRNTYRRYKEEFKRKIIFRCNNQKELWDKEFDFLSLIKEKELGKKYYNLRIQHHDLNYKKRIYIPLSDEMKKRISNKLKGHISCNKGKKWTEIQKNKLKGSHICWNKGKTNVYSDETIEKMRQAKLGKIRGSYSRKEKDVRI